MPIILKKRKTAMQFNELVQLMAGLRPRGFRAARRDGRGQETLVEKAARRAGTIGDDYKVERSLRGQRKAKRKLLHLHALRLERIDRDAHREHVGNPVAAYPPKAA